MKITPKVKKMMLTLPVEQLLRSSSQLQGHKSTPDLGNESDFNEYKNFFVGDEIKKLDWKVFARMEKLYVKKYSSDRSREIYLIFDCSASMGDEISYRYLTTFYFLINFLFLKNEIFGLILLKEEQSKIIPAGSGSQHLKTLEKAIKEVDFSGQSNYHRELLSCIKKLPEKSEIIFFSDFQNQIKDYLPVIGLIKKKSIHAYFIACFNSNLLKVNSQSNRRGEWVVDRETNQKVFFSPELVGAYEKLVFQHYQELNKIFNQKNFRFKELSSQVEDWQNFMSLFN